MDKKRSIKALVAVLVVYFGTLIALYGGGYRLGVKPTGDTASEQQKAPSVAVKSETTTTKNVEPTSNRKSVKTAKKKVKRRRHRSKPQNEVTINAEANLKAKPPGISSKIDSKTTRGAGKPVSKATSAKRSRKSVKRVQRIPPATQRFKDPVDRQLAQYKEQLAAIENDTISVDNVMRDKKLLLGATTSVSVTGSRKVTGVTSVADGRVVKAARASNSSYIVVIQHPNGYHTTYSNLTTLTVSRGDAVAKGRVIGSIPTSGRTAQLRFRVTRRVIAPGQVTLNNEAGQVAQVRSERSVNER